MKKILFLQLKSDSFGGMWFVNKTLGEKFIELGYDVKLIGIRRNHPYFDIGETNIKIDTVNKNDEWEITHRRDVINSVLKFKFFRTLIKYIKDDIKLRKDYKKLKKKIKEYNPNYIIASHYALLNGIPKEYLKRTVHVQHSSFKLAKSDKKNIKTLKKYNNKIFKMTWLSKGIYDEAIKIGITNSTYITNPVKFETDLIADVTKNKKIVIITRISKEKRIYEMIKLVDEVLKDNKDWIFEIYGPEELDDKSKKLLNKNIRYMGETKNAKEVLLNASLSLNTSKFEGLSLSIIEGFACGIPIISFNNSESIDEVINNNKNGYLIEQDNFNEMKDKLKYIIENQDVLVEKSKNAKEFSKKFNVKIVIKKWIEIFEEMDEI